MRILRAENSNESASKIYWAQLMKRITPLLLIIALTLCACVIKKPSVLAQDPQTAEMIRVGKRYMANRNYPEAARVFSSASERPFNRSSTAAIYLTGLAYFYLGDEYQSVQRFDQIIERFPRSKYRGDSQYHKALLFLKAYAPDKRYRGLNELKKLIEGSQTEDELRTLATQAFRDYLFYQSRPEFVSTYYESLPYRERAPVLDALFYHLTQTGRSAEAQQLVADFRMNGGKPSSFIEMYASEQADLPERTLYSLTLMLPFGLNRYVNVNSSEIPASHKPWLELYEGMLMALEEYEVTGGKKIFLRTLDTSNDSSSTKFKLNRLESEIPDLIIGGNRNTLKVISKWAEDHGTPLIVPLFANADAVATTSGREHIFLANPSIEVHGNRMAEFAHDSLQVRKVAIWSNGVRVTELMASSFADTFLQLGGEASYITIDSVFSNAKEEIPRLVREMKSQEFDGVYIPINRDGESANLILSLMKQQAIEAVVLGSPGWRKFNPFDRQIKEEFQLHFSTASHYDSRQPDYQLFYENYLKKYFYPPSDRTLLGYDLGRYLTFLLDNYDSRSMRLSEYLRQAPLYSGIQTAYYYRNNQINQYVNIAQYKEGEIQKVNILPLLIQDTLMPELPIWEKN